MALNTMNKFFECQLVKFGCEISSSTDSTILFAINYQSYRVDCTTSNFVITKIGDSTVLKTIAKIPPEIVTKTTEFFNFILKQ
jgi:hypothetical protein